VGGAFRLVAAITLSDEAGGARVLIALLGLLSLLVGLFLLRHVLISLASLALVLGIFWIVHGLMESLAAIADRGARSRWLSLASGILGIVAGIVVFAYPKISLVALTWILGFWVVLFGLLQIAAGFHARALARGAAIAERR